MYVEEKGRELLDACIKNKILKQRIFGSKSGNGKITYK